MRSLWSLLFPRLNNPNSLSLSSRRRCSSSVFIFVTLLWTHSDRSTPFLCWWAPELNTVLQVRFHQGRVEWQNHLPWPAGHASVDAAHNMVGLLGCYCLLPALIQFFIHQYPQVFLIRGALNPLIAQTVSVFGIAPTQVQEIALGLIELHDIHMGPPL